MIWQLPMPFIFRSALHWVVYCTQSSVTSNKIICTIKRCSRCTSQTVKMSSYCKKFHYYHTLFILPVCVSEKNQSALLPLHWKATHLCFFYSLRIVACYDWLIAMMNIFQPWMHISASLFVQTHRGRSGGTIWPAGCSAQSVSSAFWWRTSTTV